jgi:hypothetical protein
MDRIMPATFSSEVWLRTNRRALQLGMILPAVVLVAALAGAGYWFQTNGMQSWFAWLHVAVALGAGYLLLVLAWHMNQPRLAYQAGRLLVFLGDREPIEVPIDIVEVFFLGQGPSHLPPVAGKEPETQNIIVRLAESAKEWEHRDVKPALGMWCQSYITIRGAWCEPITKEAMRRLNARLVEVQREQKAQRQEAAQA